jgi:DNA-binding transcriptional MocR family regulator
MWLEDGGVEATLKRKRQAATQRQRLARTVLGAGRVSAHPRALHVWVSLPEPWRAESFATAASQHQLVVTPSAAFWMRRSTPPPFIRIALGGVDDLQKLKRRLATIAELMVAT